MNKQNKIRHPILVSALIVFLAFGFTSNLNRMLTGTKFAWYQTGEQMLIDSTNAIPRGEGIHFDHHFEVAPSDSILYGWWYEHISDSLYVSYLMNETDHVQHFERQDGSLIMIQEALDQNGEWKPIEFWVPSGCGNSYFNPLKLKPGHCVMVPVVKYSGDYETKFRFKLVRDSTLFYSEPFTGSIELSQFERDEEDKRGVLYYGRGVYLDDWVR